MTGKRKAPLWRQAFLRALKRTGNVRASAFEAGVDPGTAYDHRAKDARFRGAWAGALKAYGARPSPSLSPNGRGKQELVLRRSKAGDRLVRAAPGRWSAPIEESFLDALGETGCVRTAAASVKMSTQALYARRDKYPEFGTRWDERVARFNAQLPGLLGAAAVRGLSPAPEGAKRRGRARLPAMNMDQSIRLHAINEKAKAKAGRGRGLRPPEATEEEVAEALNAQLDLLDRRIARERRAAGWTVVGDGIWLPPGWTAAGPPGPPSPEGSPDQERRRLP